MKYFFFYNLVLASLFIIKHHRQYMMKTHRVITDKEAVIKTQEALYNLHIYWTSQSLVRILFDACVRVICLLWWQDLNSYLYSISRSGKSRPKDSRAGLALPWEGLPMGSQPWRRDDGGPSASSLIGRSPRKRNCKQTRRTPLVWDTICSWKWGMDFQTRLPSFPACCPFSQSLPVVILGLDRAGKTTVYTGCSSMNL